MANHFAWHYLDLYIHVICAFCRFFSLIVIAYTYWYFIFVLFTVWISFTALWSAIVVWWVLHRQIKWKWNEPEESRWSNSIFRRMQRNFDPSRSLCNLSVTMMKLLESAGSTNPDQKNLSPHPLCIKSHSHRILNWLVEYFLLLPLTFLLLIKWFSNPTLCPQLSGVDFSFPPDPDQDKQLQDGWIEIVLKVLHSTFFLSATPWVTGNVFPLLFIGFFLQNPYLPSSHFV